MSDQFDARYRIKPRRANNPAVAKRVLAAIEQQQEIQSAIPSRPSNIGWFERLVRDFYEGDDRPRIGYYCNLVPQELIAALGASPVRLGCGNPALVSPGEEVFAGEICPLVKTSLACFLDESSPHRRSQAVIVPASCDAKKKMGEVLSDFVPTFCFNLPAEQDARRYASIVTGELKRMTAFLTRILGVKLRRRELLRQIELGRERARIVRALQDERSDDPSKMSVRDLFIIVQASFSGVPLEEWNAQASAVLDELRAKEKTAGSDRPRLVLTGAAIIWPNFKILNLIEDLHADVVADTLCTGAQSAVDPVVVDEKSMGAIYRALAFRYVFGAPCPCFVSQATRISRVLDLVEEHRADAVVNHGLHLCQLFDIETYRLSSILKEKKIPFYTLRTDYSPGDYNQLKIRLEAFLETLIDEF